MYAESETQDFEKDRLFEAKCQIVPGQLSLTSQHYGEGGPLAFFSSILEVAL